MELTVKNIKKSYGAENVLRGVDFTVKEGEIHALLGENGAGKSTLMNMIGGLFLPDEGQILLDGKPVVFRSPEDSQKHGIAFIHQSLGLINDLTVYEYIFLSGFLRRGVFLDIKAMAAQTASLFERLGVAIDPYAMISELDMSCKQMVAIARALHAQASLIIMDEPTSSLTNDEVERLFGVMRALRQKGVSMIFISHKLREVMAICDRYTVLRNGTVVQTGPIADTTLREITTAMIGRDLADAHPHTAAPYGEVALQLKHLSDGKSFFDVSLDVRKGEILGITGLLGDGHSELFRTVFGVYGRHYTGEIRMEGNRIHPGNTGAAKRAGLALLANDRIETGILPDMNIVDNSTITVLNDLRKGPWLDTKKQHALLEKQIKRLKIKAPDTEALIVHLSGGNQQKILLSKWLLSRPRVLILDNPTQGVDVGVKEDFYTIIESLANNGMAVIVLSPDPQEIVRVCDRALVMYHGRVVSAAEGSDMNVENLMYLATGASLQ